jgi:exonuclease III
MKILFWNIRGFGKVARRRQIRDYIMGEDVKGIGIQETMREDFSQKDLSEIAGNKSFKWIWKSARGHSGVSCWISRMKHMKLRILR